VPITWNELVTLRSGAQWTVQTLPQRLTELAGHDPWTGYEAARQVLSAGVLRQLQRS
jgi:bifunctional non-homologous end joining protein LigD